MTSIKNLSIPEACHQSWQHMTTVNEGRHCQSCCKTVIDFTAMSNEQIVAHLSAKNNVCGRFEHGQLNQLNQELYISDLSAKGKWARILAVVGMLTTIGSLKANGQTKSPIVKTSDTSHTLQTDSFMLGKVLRTDSLPKKINDGNNHVLVKGKVTHKVDGAALPGATIKIKGTNTSTQTDTNGNFSIYVQDEYQMLKVSYIGFVSQEIPLSGDVNKVFDIKMQENTAMMGEVVVVRYSLPKRIWYKIKRIF